jgi:SM-20-related protein
MPFQKMNPHFDFIADGLAEEGFAVCDQFLSQTEVDAILELEHFTNRVNSFQKAGIGKSRDLQINEAIRGDHIHWLDRDTCGPAARDYLDRLGEMVQFLNQALFLSLKDYEVHLTIYPPGAFYKRHLDQFRADDHRKLSAICYLNNEWQAENGGQLRMYLPKSTLDVLPVSGRLVVFRSDQIEHEVLPANRDRLSLTGWILDQYSDLRHI